MYVHTYTQTCSTNWPVGLSKLHMPKAIVIYKVALMWMEMLALRKLCLILQKCCCIIMKASNEKCLFSMRQVEEQQAVSLMLHSHSVDTIALEQGSKKCLRQLRGKKKEK